MNHILIESGQKMGKKISRIEGKGGNGEKIRNAQSYTRIKSDYELESFDGIIKNVSSSEIVKEDIDEYPKYSFNVAVTETDYEHHLLTDEFHNVMEEPLEEENTLEKLHKIEKARHFFMEL
jgi:glycyl-tRNA synthetase alpha subunit